MLVKRSLLVVVAGLSAGGTGYAQSGGPEPVLRALEKGPLVVWVVSLATAEDKLRQTLKRRAASLAVKLPTTVQQQTAGSFGTPSSNVGQTAGSYGQTAGSLGQASSNVGQTAGSYGTASSDHGTSASSVGQTAGSYGQTAGSFGQPASTLGQTAGSYGQTSGANVGQQNGTNRDAIGAGANPTAVNVSARGYGDDRGDMSERSSLWNEVAFELRAEFTGFQVRVLDVLDNELREKLTGAQGTEAYPDVILGTELPAWWDESGVGLAMLGLLRQFSGDGPEDNLPRLNRAILVKAQHPLAARAFVVWLSDRGMCRDCVSPADVDKDVQVPVQAAVSGLLRVLAGKSLGSEADEEAATFSANDAQITAWAWPSLAELSGLNVRVDIDSAVANEHLAVVGMRAIGETGGAFGVVHAVSVLRRNAAGRWKVLEISANEPVRRWSALESGLKAYARPGDTAKVAGVSLAAPADGDSRQPQPDLWWDNGSGAGLLVVESQRKLGTTWSAPRIDLVPNRDPREKTRVTAVFAKNGPYRWRVWAVGTGGTVVLSSWRSFVVQP